MIKMITDDSVLNVCKFLNDKHKIRFLSTTTTLNKLKMKVTFRTRLTTKQIDHLPYFDQFTEIFLENAATRIPSNVKIVKISSDFDGPIETLQSYKYITHIYFGTDFHQEIKDKLPPNVKYLSFQSYYKHFYPDAIPNSVVTMIISGGYDPEWSPNHNKSPPHWIPDTVTNLTIRHVYGRDIRLSPNLTHLSVNFRERYALSIPSNLKFLHVSYHDGDTCVIPQTVERLHIQYCGVLPLNFIPSGVKYLTLTSVYSNNNVPSDLPGSIEYLRLDAHVFPFSLSILPQSLKILTVRSADYHRLINSSERRPELKIKKLTNHYNK